MVCKSISVFTITYNQEQVIAKTLDSILTQKEWGLKYIFIGDDCSTDGTWNIIQKYKAEYPDIIVPFRNDHNLGIYANIQNLVSRRKISDLYTHLAGDDCLCKGFFKAVQEFVRIKNIDTNEPVGIYADYKKVRGDKESICSQSPVLSGNTLFSLYIRKKISLRSALFTEAVIKQCGPVILDGGLNLAESMYDVQYHLNVGKSYYLPYVGTAYNMGIGISSRMDMLSYRTEQSLVKWQYFLEHYAQLPVDKYYLQYCIEECKFKLKPTLSRYFMMLKLYQKGRLHNIVSVRESIGAFYSLIRYYWGTRNFKSA